MTIRITTLLLLIPTMYAASLKPESVQAWDRYVAAAEAKLEDRAKGRAAFLWVDESAERRRRVQSGEIVVLETSSGVSKKAPSAQIHHWMGAAFIPGATIGDVMSVTRNYAKYPEYYSPNVVSSKTVSRDQNTDRFSVLLVNQAVLLKTAVETDCRGTFAQVDDKRWYGKLSATRIQEIEDYGHSGEHRLPVGEGGGYLWRLGSLTRFEERDGGVYFEVEAMALSRDVPFSLRFIVDPVVKRVSRNSLLESLRQTGKAVSELVAVNGGTSKVASERDHFPPRARSANALGMAVTNQ